MEGDENTLWGVGGGYAMYNYPRPDPNPDQIPNQPTRVGGLYGYVDPNPNQNQPTRVGGLYGYVDPNPNQNQPTRVGGLYGYVDQNPNQNQPARVGGYVDDLYNQMARLTLMQTSPFSSGDHLHDLRLHDIMRMRIHAATLDGLLNHAPADAQPQPQAQARLSTHNRNYLAAAPQRFYCRSNNNNNVGARTRQQQPRVFSLSEMRGNIVSVAKDQYGCRFLQSKFEEGKPEDIQMIFSEVKDHVPALMVHQFGNYLIQKFIEVCNAEQMTQLLLLVIDDDRRFAEICADMYGTRAVQKLLEHLTTQEQICRFLCVLRRITVPLTKTMNGHHVIQYCLRTFSAQDNKHILNAVADNCLDIAFDKSGCCVLQQCLDHALGEARQRLIVELTSNSLELSEHPFGNYVVQYILGLRMRQATDEILRQLSGNFVSLCMDKYGSNVVERCLKEAQEDQIIPVIEEIIYSPNFLRVLQDPFGNYVAQRALEACKGPLLHAIIEMINRNAANLHSHPHGKRVLEKTTKVYF